MTTIRRLVLLAVPLFAAAQVAGSQASFNAESADRNNVFATTSLYAPGGLTATPSGHDVGLSWSAGQNGNGYAIRGAANGTSSNCSGVSYAAVGTASGTSYTDSGRFSPQGTWFCYQALTSYASWTSVNGNPTAAAQLGVVAASVAATNGGTAGRLDTGDTITVTFNQPISPATGPSGTDSVCAVAGSTIMLGSTKTNGACGTGETVHLGKLTGGTTTAAGRWNATYTWSAANTKLTVTLGTRTQGGANVTTSGTWTLGPTTTAADLLSAGGGFHVCDTNSGGGNCLPTLTGGF